MSDLVSRLRYEGSTGLDLSPGDPLSKEAAVEIERLRTNLTLLREAIGTYLESTHEDAVGELRKALIETEEK